MIITQAMMQIARNANEELKESKRPKKSNTLIKSDKKGVSWCSTNRKWRAVIYVAGTTKSLGSFLKEKDAIAAREKAEKEYYDK